MNALLRIPAVHVVETLWQEEEGKPDALWVALSTGYMFTLRHDTDAGYYRVYADGGDWLVAETEEESVTRLTRAELNRLGDLVWRRFAENQEGVERTQAEIDLSMAVVATAREVTS